jgi:hypothetical protein
MRGRNTRTMVRALTRLPLLSEGEEYWYCKIKRVNPRLPLHVHSAVTAGLTGIEAGKPA